VAIPILKERFRAALAAKQAADRKCDDDGASEPAPEASESQVDREGLLESYEGTFEEYLEIVIQFGHIALFGFCWPLCPLFAVLNNMIEVWFFTAPNYFLCRPSPLLISSHLSRPAFSNADPL
jgi:hypothetical protein